MIACSKTRWITVANYLTAQALVIILAGYFAISPFGDYLPSVDSIDQRPIVASQSGHTWASLRQYNMFYPGYAGEETDRSYMNRSGIELVKFYEGFRPVPYRDAAGHRTIGYGHKIRPGEKFTRITRAEAEALLAQDLLEAENVVRETVKVQLSSNQYAALVSFVYNVGPHSFRKSTLLAKLNRGSYAAVPSEMRRWVNAADRQLKGLKKRREAEIALFQTRDFALNGEAELISSSGEL